MLVCRGHCGGYPDGYPDGYQDGSKQREDGQEERQDEDETKQHREGQKGNDAAPHSVPLQRYRFDLTVGAQVSTPSAYYMA